MSENILKHLEENKLKTTFQIFNRLNKDNSHKLSNDDICTPMECVKTMLDYLPNELWHKENLKILDPCCGNGNFGAYAAFKTDMKNIYFNEINPLRYENCKKILNPLHLSNFNYLGLEFSAQCKEHFDLIMANPPYSGGGNKNRSISNQFIESSIDKLNDKGYLCFVTPNNYMTFNNNNTTLKKLLNLGSFLVIDNDVKKYFNGVGSSFSIMVWQKGVTDNQTKIINNYLLKDTQIVRIPQNLPFLPLYMSQNILNITQKLIATSKNRFTYRCDLHNFTQKAFLSDSQDKTHKYRTIHTARKTRYASKKQDIYDKYIIIIPLSTYYKPYIEHHTNTTQSVGYFAFDSKNEALAYLKRITQPHFKLLIHLTRYGNFNNIMVLKHIKFDDLIEFTQSELAEIAKLSAKMRY